MRTPTFFILGAPKCGTTAIAQYLSAHPDVFLSSPKEPHFFDGNYEKGMAAYIKDHYAKWNSEAAAGEATPSYFAVPYVAERIRVAAPEAQLIVILRNPVERAFSSWWMFHARGMEPLSLADAIAAEEKLLAAGHPLEGDGAERTWKSHVRQLRAGKPLQVRTYLYTGHYARHLQRYLQLFPERNIKIVFSHQLRDQPADTVQDLWRFIGVDEQATLPDFDTVNEALGTAARPVMRLLQALGLMQLRSLLPVSTKSWIKKGLARLGDRHEMDSETKDHLTDYFEPHIRELESLLGEDLSVWRR